MAGELERPAERQRLGLEPLPPEDGGGTLGELLRWWLETYIKETASSERTASAVDRHFLRSELAEIRLVQLTPGVIETYLQSRGSDIGPNSVNHLRSFLATAFTRAQRAGRWSGGNPALLVARRKVPKRLPDFLRAHEVPLVLGALPKKQLSLFAAAIYTGMRKGELAGLRKSDVDFRSGLINICRSYHRATTKGARAAAIPIATELAPYLERAVAASTSDLVFPGPDGKMMSPNSPLEEVLRRALAHAGIVEHYVHICRKKGCDYREEAPDAGLRRCPDHAYKLWPKAKVRRIRFHDLRHTAASLLIMAGANPAAVQRILRHSDPRITTEVYGHLLPGYLKAEVDRLSFGLPSNELQPVAALSSPLVTPLLQGPANDTGEGGAPCEIPDDSVAHPVGFEPTTLGFEVRCSIQLS